MSSPRVFISSTYYDLKYVRDDLYNFILSLGYEPVMHDRGTVPYSQKQTLEQSCYDEISACDILICIIGNRYGTKSSESDFSITMEELQHAIKDKKKIYVYILNEVNTENATYLKNKDLPVEYAFADNIKIHHFIADIKEKLTDRPITPFSNVSDIINNLKTQFAGLFQLLLRKDASATEMTTYNDLEELVGRLKNVVEDFNDSKTELFREFNGTVIAINPFAKILRQTLGIEKFGLYITNLKSVDEFLCMIGFEKCEDDGFNDYVYKRNVANGIESIKISRNLFDYGNDNIINNNISLESIRNGITKTIDPYRIKGNGEFPEDIPF